MKRILLILFIFSNIQSQRDQDQDIVKAMLALGGVASFGITAASLYNKWKADQRNRKVKTRSKKQPGHYTSLNKILFEENPVPTWGVIIGASCLGTLYLMNKNSHDPSQGDLFDNDISG